MKLLGNLAGEFHLTRGSRWTWLCGISPLLCCGAFLLAALLIMCGLGDSLLMLFPLLATWLFTFFAIFLAIPMWCILLLFHKFRLGWRTHIAQACVFASSWIVTLLL